MKRVLKWVTIAALGYYLGAGPGADLLARVLVPVAAVQPEPIPPPTLPEAPNPHFQTPMGPLHF